MNYDCIVIGAGCNGLTTAGLLAKGGRRVLVLEARTTIGGLASSEEFHPGYRSAGILQDTSGLRRAVVNELQLTDHGLVLRPRRPGVLALGQAGESLFLDGDPQRAAETIGRRSADDGRAYLKWRAFLDNVRGVIEGFVDAPPMDLVHLERLKLWDVALRGLALQRLGRREMLELLRIPPMSLADWLTDMFETDLLRSALALPALSGGFAGPRSPGTAANLLIAEASAGTGVEGGGPALVAALERACKSHGVEIRTGCHVKKILTTPEGVRGVRLDEGEEIAAACVAASCDPRQALLDQVEPGRIPSRLEQHMRHFRCRGTTAVVRYALNAPPVLPGADGEPVELIRVARGLDDLEQAFDPVKYRRQPTRPALELHLPGVSTADLAPAGGAVLSVLVHFVTYDLDGGWDDGQRETLAGNVESVLEESIPGLTSTIIGREVLAPVDLESRYGLTGGHILHGEQALDQLLIRPAPDCVGYRTPLPGLFLNGSGSHPGGGLTCAPGRLAAAAIRG